MPEELPFGRWMKQLRATLDLTQEALAEAVGCAPQTIRMYENGRRRPSRELVKRLADTLCVPPDQRAAFVRAARTSPEPSLPHRHDAQQAHPFDTDKAHTAHAVPLPESNLILATKLYRPRPRAGLVSRQRLLHQLNAGLGGALTLIAAPAGSGKTSLVTDWLRELDNTIQVAWLALDATDSQPAHFLRYLLAAIQTIDSARGRQVLSLLDTISEERVDVLLPLVINEFTLLPERSIVVLDDYHVIDTPAVHHIIQFLLDHLPPQLHLVIASRVDPPLALSRLRVRGQLTELRMQDLRFTAEEAAAFFHDTMHLSLSLEDVVALEQRTEGWIAGLQMAALSLQHRPPEQMAAFIEAFARSHRFVVDYLAEEVLARQPRHIQRFLLHTSILERLSGPLCDAVLLGDVPSDEQAYSQLVLEQIERSNVFLLPLGDDRHWYRYHHLFAEVLRSKLRAAVPASHVHTLSLRAAHWHEQQGMLEDAIRYALAAEQPAQAARVVEQHAMALMERNAYGELRGWLEQLPKEIIWRSSRLCLAQASVDVDANPAQVEPLLARATTLASGAATDHVAWLDAVSTVSTVIRGILAGRAHRYEEAIALLEQVLPTGDIGSSYLVGMATLQLGIVHLLRGELQEAQARFTSLLNTHAHGAVLGGFVIEAVARLGQALMARGQLHEAARLYERSLGQLQGHSSLPTFSLIHLGLAEVCYEWNDIPRAQTQLDTARDLGERFASIDGLIGMYTSRARVLLARGDRDGALVLARKAQELLDVGGMNTSSRRLLPLGKLLLVLGDGNTVQQWVQRRGVRPEHEVTADTEQEHLLLARLLVIQHNWQAVHELTHRLFRYAAAQGRMGTTIEVLLLQALAHLAQGQHTDAHSKLTEALGGAAPEGYHRLFVDEGAPVAQMLSTALHASEWRREVEAYEHPIRGYAEQLLATCQAEGIVAPANVVPAIPPARHTSGDMGVEPLTERELQVLRLLALGHSNHAIAEQLVIAVGTVKRHINSILGKLAVQSRLQAVARARELNVL